jgi:hypothetical protein
MQREHRDFLVIQTIRGKFSPLAIVNEAIRRIPVLDDI